MIDLESSRNDLSEVEVNSGRSCMVVKTSMLWERVSLLEKEPAFLVGYMSPAYRTIGFPF